MSGPVVTIQLPEKRILRTCSSADRPPTRLARQLALAHLVQGLVESGELESYAAAALRLRITRARMAQVLALLNLAPKLQEQILAGKLRISERALRPVLREVSWKKQIAGSSRLREALFTS